ncbi:hypothetical protein M434DRAFT_16826 [Hypoxylon sp. CO27-5]|nr:hypothetical protein M434DRAFT_16826 [Hypoxylon sp. CO27-5]
MYQRRYKTQKSVVWVQGMRLGEGQRHDFHFGRRAEQSSRWSGSGTIDDPMVVWLTPGPPRYAEAVLQTTENIVREETRKCGLSHAWIVSEGHSFSTTGWSRAGDRILSLDDNHVTLRMGSSPNTSNLQGHLYIIYENNNPEMKALRMMREDERGVVGGRNPQLWVCGKYPPDWPRAGIKYPESPYEVIAGSLLDKFQEAMHEQEQRKKRAH